VNNSIIRPLIPSDREVAEIQDSIQRELGLKVHWGTANLLAQASMLLEEYEEYGKLTVRQLYYLLVSRGAIKNSNGSYQRFGHHLTTGRNAGVIPWDAFEDRARMFHREPYPRYDLADEEEPEEALRSWFEYALDPRVSKEYEFRKWEGQAYYVELWVEKDALAGFLAPIAKELGVVLVVSKGFTSLTFRREASRRFEEAANEGKKAVLLYLGDLDPSGVDIYRVLKNEMADVAIVLRLGLNVEDIAEFGLIPCTIKEDDTRTKGYRKMFPQLGDKVFELDALPPGELKSRATRGIMKFFNTDVAEEKNKEARHWRARFTDHQDRIRELLKESGMDLGK
jgi:hypothetical protein